MINKPFSAPNSEFQFVWPHQHQAHRLGFGHEATAVQTVLRIQPWGSWGSFKNDAGSMCLNFEYKYLLWEDEIKQILKVWVSRSQHQHHLELHSNMYVLGPSPQTC